MGNCISRSRKGKFVINENNNCYVVDMPHKKYGAGKGVNREGTTFQRTFEDKKKVEIVYGSADT